MSSAHPVLAHYDSLLVDLDGTVFEGGRPIDGAAQGLESHCQRGTVMYVTNNASRSPEQVAEHLNSLGFVATAESVVTSAMAAVDLAVAHIKSKGIQQPTAYVIGAQSFRSLASAAGFRLVDSADDCPNVVLHGHSPDNNWATLSEGALSIRRGAQYIASNLDTTLPNERGLLVGNGSMVAAVVSATGVTPISAGKPEPAMFESAAQRVGACRPLAVGDRLDTDIAGGNAAGMDTLCVLTGVSGHWDVLRAPVEQRPTFIAANLRDHLPGWSARHVSTVDGEHVFHVSSGTLPDALPEAPAHPELLMAAEAAAVVAPFVWALVDSMGHDEEAREVVWQSIRVVGDDPAACAALEHWR